MVRKVVVFFFGAMWVALAYLLWPDAIFDRPFSELRLSDALWAAASIAAVIVGIVACVLTWRR